MLAKVRIEGILNPCSICKHRDSHTCNECISSNNDFLLIGSKFLADTTKINAHFVDQFYELLNDYATLLHRSGLKVEIEQYMNVD